MIKEVVIPEIGENITTGDVVKLLVSVGDTVAIDQSLVELETDKAVVEIPSTAAGRVTEILVAEGTTVEIGRPIVKIDDSATAEQVVEQPVTPEPAPKPARQKTKPEPAKPSAPAPVAVETKPAEKPKPAVMSRTDALRRAARGEGGSVAAPPSVRRLARELGVDIGTVPGSGPGGRVSADDVKDFAKGVVSGMGTPSAGVAVPPAEETERVPMTKIRKLTAEAMTYSWVTVPHVTQYDKADITDLEEARKKFGKDVAISGGKLTVTSILTKVAAAALKVFPQFNASADMEAQEIVLKKYYHIGVAVDTDRGLLVPVVRNVDRKNISQLSAELADLADRARNKKIKPDELAGGNFTISNLGGIGGTIFSPIVYSPQVAIIGVGRAVMEPKYVDGKFVPRLMLPLAVSYDHRVIDGADGARFLRWVCEALEEPFLMPLSG